MPRADALPAVWAGPRSEGLDPDAVARAVSRERSCPLLPEHGPGGSGGPGCAGYRVDTSAAPARAVVTGQDWSPLFQPVRTVRSGDGSQARVEAADATAGLRLVTEIEAVPGGAIRARHTLTNAGRLPYAVTALDVIFPLPAEAAEILDFSGRHLFERTPQRHRVTDGLWLREGRRGHTGADAPSLLVAGVPGFGFGGGEVWGVHVAWSGDQRTWSSACRRARARTPRSSVAASCCGPARSASRRATYTTPVCHLTWSDAGLDGLADRFHALLRARPRTRAPRAPWCSTLGGGLLRPRPRPVAPPRRAGRRGRRGALRAGRRLVHRPPSRRRRARRLAGGRTGLAGRAAPPGGSRPARAAAARPPGRAAPASASRARARPGPAVPGQRRDPGRAGRPAGRGRQATRSSLRPR